MKKRKIRGMRRRHRAVERWIADNLALRDDLLKTYQEDHCDIVVHPWCDLSMTGSVIPPAKGKTKLLMIHGLVRIYHALKAQLDARGQDYYLRIWLFLPRFQLSRVVCAVGKSKDFYEAELAESGKELLPTNVFPNARQMLQSFSWQRRDDNDYYSQNDLGGPEDYACVADYLEQEKWFTELLKTPHTISRLGNAAGSFTETYCFRRGNIWIGALETTAKQAQDASHNA